MDTFVFKKMALLDEHSCECIKSELDLFSVPSTQTSVDESRYETVYPVGSLSTTTGPIEFRFNTGDKDYVDLQNTFLYIKCRILKNNDDTLKEPQQDAAITDDAFVYPINYFFATQFKNVEITLSNKTVSSPDTLYPYRAYIENLLSYGQIEDEQLQCAMYFKDQGDMDIHDKTINNENCSNKSAASRFKKTKFSSIVEMWGRIHSELFAQPKLMLNKMDMTVKFHRHSPEFSLMAFDENERYKVLITEAELHIARKRIADSVREAHEIALLKNNAKYPIRQVDMKFFTRAVGLSDLSEPNLHTGILPRRVIVGIVTSKAYNGSLHANPLNFEHMKLRSIILKKNDKPLPFKQIECNFTENSFGQSYFSLFHGTGRLFRDQKIDLTPNRYKNGHTLYVFDLSQDWAESNASLLEEGKLSLEIKLHEALSQTAVIVVYQETENIIEIDANRNVKYE